MTKFLCRLGLAGFLFLLPTGSPQAAAKSITARQALEYFQEADALTRADGGKLWGVSLGGGLLLVDPETRIAYANQPDTEGRLRRVGQVLRGEISTDVNLAHTSLDWAGGRWSMILLPLPENKEVRGTLIVHELWHGVQEKLGLPASTAANNHLDTPDARYWLQLEWRALAAALAAKGAKQAEAIRDAALFRERRRALFPGSAALENSMEIHEGLAEYTGVKLSGASDPAKFVIENELRDAPKKPSFVRSFAYANGPAYGLLLDATGAPWREHLHPAADLAALLRQRLKIELPAEISDAAAARARQYDGASLAAAEESREKTRRALVADYRARLVEGAVLKIPLRQMQMQFDPGNLVPLESLGTVYPQYPDCGRMGHPERNQPRGPAQCRFLADRALAPEKYRYAESRRRRLVLGTQTGLVDRPRREERRLHPALAIRVTATLRMRPATKSRLRPFSSEPSLPTHSTSSLCVYIFDFPVSCPPWRQSFSQAALPAHKISRIRRACSVSQPPTGTRLFSLTAVSSTPSEKAAAPPAVSPVAPATVPSRTFPRMENSSPSPRNTTATPRSTSCPATAANRNA